MTKPLPEYDHEKALIHKNEPGSNSNRKTMYADIAKKIQEKYELSNAKDIARVLRSAHEQYLIDEKSTERLSVTGRKRYFLRIKKNTDLLIEALDGLEPGLQELVIENVGLAQNDDFMEKLIDNLELLRASLSKSEPDFCAPNRYPYTPLEVFILEMGDFFYERIDDSTYLPVTMPTENSPDNSSCGRFVDFLMFVGAELGMILEARKLARAVHNLIQKKLKPEQKSHRK